MRSRKSASLNLSNPWKLQRNSTVIIVLYQNTKITQDVFLTQVLFEYFQIPAIIAHFKTKKFVVNIGFWEIMKRKTAYHKIQNISFKNK